MSVILITYDIKKQEKNNPALYNLIKHYFHIKLSESTYAIYTDEPTSFIYSKFKDFVGKDDRLYIIKLQKPWSGYGPRENRDWLINYF